MIYNSETNSFSEQGPSTTRTRRIAPSGQCFMAAANAINNFDWNNTDQGSRYWGDIYEELMVMHVDHQEAQELDHGSD
jgi:hypothetical protein